MHASHSVNLSAANVSDGGEEQSTGVVSGMVPLRDDDSGAAAAGRRSRSSFSGKYL